MNHPSCVGPDKAYGFEDLRATIQVPMPYIKRQPFVKHYRIDAAHSECHVAAVGARDVHGARTFAAMASLITAKKRLRLRHRIARRGCRVGDNLSGRPHDRTIRGKKTVEFLKIADRHPKIIVEEHDDIDTPCKVFNSRI